MTCDCTIHYRYSNSLFFCWRNRYGVHDFINQIPAALVPCGVHVSAHSLVADIEIETNFVSVADGNIKTLRIRHGIGTILYYECITLIVSEYLDPVVFPEKFRIWVVWIIIVFVMFLFPVPDTSQRS